MEPAHFPFKAVTFDVDGTLYNVKRYQVLFVLRHLRHLGFMRRFVAARDELRSRENVRDFRAEQAALVARRTRLPVTDAAGLIRTLLYGRWPEFLGRVKPFEYAGAVLEALAAKGIPFAAVSDYPCGEKIWRLGLGRHPWAAQLDCEAAGALKPWPAVFRQACDALGAAPHEVLHIGDREDTDVAGALAAGMHAALFDRKRDRRRRPRETRAERVLKDFNELLRWINGWPL